jgi:enoyl-CoA hydratase
LRAIVSFLNGFVMGGGIGIGCHASHRIVGATSRLAMPENSIGLVPDVGGTLLPARAPGRLGEYLALTAARMTGADAIHASFADHYIPEAEWHDLKAVLAQNGGSDFATAAAVKHPPSNLAAARVEIDQLFRASDLSKILSTLASADSDFAKDAAKCTAGNGRQPSTVGGGPSGR